MFHVARFFQELTVKKLDQVSREKQELVGKLEKSAEEAANLNGTLSAGFPLHPSSCQLVDLDVKLATLFICSESTSLEARRCRYLDR